MKERGKTCPNDDRITSAATRANSATNDIVRKCSKRRRWERLMTTMLMGGNKNVYESRRQRKRRQQGLFEKQGRREREKWGKLGI